jgi:hypothetical protein
VQDASFLITVPLVEPDVPALRSRRSWPPWPILHAAGALQADIVLDTDPELDTIDADARVPRLADVRVDSLADRHPRPGSDRSGGAARVSAAMVRRNDSRSRAVPRGVGRRLRSASRRRVQCCEMFEISNTARRWTTPPGNGSSAACKSRRSEPGACGERVAALGIFKWGVVRGGKIW